MPPPMDRAATGLPDVWGEAGRPSRRQVLFDVALGAAVGLVAITIHVQQGAASAIAAALLALAVALRRVWLPAMIALAFAAAALQLVTSDLAVVADLAYGPLAFTLGAHRSAAVRRWGLACAAAAMLVAGAWGIVSQLARSGPASVFTGVAMAAMAAVIAGGGWVSGYLRWQRRRAIQARVDASLQVVEQRRLVGLVAQERERARIAADMHDVVAHSWAVVAAQADGARYLLRADPAQAEVALEVIGDTARSAMTDVRRLLTELREGHAEPPAGDRDHRSDLAARMRGAGMDLVLHRTGIPARGEAIEQTARRVLAESLTNALKHGDLNSPVVVEERWHDGYVLRVENAVDPASATSRIDGHGLLGMSQRVKAAGGTMTAGIQENRWVVQIAIPEPHDPQPSGVMGSDGVTGVTA